MTRFSCKICSTDSVPFSRGTILNRYEIQYFRCPACGFFQTEEPYWLEEAYSAAITPTDVGLVQRNLHFGAVTRVLLTVFFGRRGRFLDYAGGYGLFVRLMRDGGYDFRWFDKYCENIFARGFEASGAGPYDLLTAFEVFEHLADPLEEVSRMLALSDSILFTTQLLPEPVPKQEEWWFYGMEHGQHVSFHTRRSLEKMGEKLGMNFHSNGSSMHLFTRKRLNGSLFSALARYKVSRFMAPFCRRTSLLPADFRAVTGAKL